jgi:outer membrane lipoprotein carrier protein
MKTLKNIIVLCLFSLLLPLSVQAQTPSNAGASVGSTVPAAVDAIWTTDPVLLKLTGFYANTTNFTATFKQVVNTKSPKRTFKRGGKVYFKRPVMMRWDYSSPETVYYISNGKDLWLYEVEEASAMRMNVSDSELFSSLGFLTGSAKLSESFNPEVKAVGADGIATVKLVPKEKNGTYRSLTVQVKTSTGEVVETEVEDPLGNKSRIRFESPVYDEIPAASFEFKVPKGVKVQDLSNPEASTDKAGKK